MFETVFAMASAIQYELESDSGFQTESAILYVLEFEMVSVMA